MKNIFNIKIHFFFYVVFFIAIITGKFKTFLILTMITIIHELGHIIGGLIFDYKIERVILMPISLLTIFNTKINNKWHEELIVTILGPLFQILLFWIINDKIILKYNLWLLIFNLLPIFPLDGSKLLKIFLYDYLPFRKVEKINIYLSLSFLLIINVILFKNVIVFLLSIIFIFKIIYEIKNLDFVYNKFLFERYLYNIRFKRIKTIYNYKSDDMYKYYYHHFLTKNKIEEESDFLLKMFDNKGNL